MTGNQIAYWNVRRQEAADLAHAMAENEKNRINDFVAKLQEIELNHKIWFDKFKLQSEERRHQNQLALEERLGMINAQVNWYRAESERLNANTNWYNAQSQHEDRVARRVEEQRQFDAKNWLQTKELELETWKVHRQYDPWGGTESQKAAGSVLGGMGTFMRGFSSSIPNLFKLLEEPKTTKSNQSKGGNKK